MPYISRNEKPYFEVPLEILHSINTPGQFNYLLTRLAIAYLSNNGKSYKTYNDIIGALECCKQELYRRSVAPYENTKIQENGDVYED